MRVLLIGDGERDEMRGIVRWAEQAAQPLPLLRAASVPAARNLDGADRADLIVVLEAHPDEHTAGDVNALFALAPLGRIVCCAGSWSESAGRTRKIWPLALRVPALQAIERLERERSLLQNGAAVSLPPTGSREEWFAAHHPPAAIAAASTPQTVRIVSPDAPYRRMLCDLLAQAGHRVVDGDATSARVVLWDADPWHPRRSEELARWTSAADVIALTGWALPDLVRDLRRLGVRTVLPKLGDCRRIIAAITPAAAPDADCGNADRSSDRAPAD